MPTPFVIEVSLPPAQVRARIAAALKPVPLLAAVRPPADSTQFWGRVDARQFEVRLPHSGRNSFRATLTGSLAPIAGGTRLTIRPTGFAFAPVIFVVWLSTVVSWGIAAFRRGDGQSLLILGGMAAFGVWILRMGWRIYDEQAKELERRLRAALEAP